MESTDAALHSGDDLGFVFRARAFVRRESKLWATDEGVRLVFVGKILLASFLALWIGFRLDLGMTRWSVVSIYIIMQPESGMVIEKGFYQFLATMVGCLVSLVLAAAFYHEAALFFVALACWAAYCLRGSLRTLGHGNFRAYAWALSSYTVFVVGIPAALNPESAFAIVVTRATEMSVGIACATLVSALVLPVKSKTRVVALARRIFERFAGHAAARATEETEDIVIQEEFMDLRERQEGAMRAAVFEDPANAALNVRAGRLNGLFLTLSTRLHLFRMFRRRVGAESPAGAAFVAAVDAIPGLFPSHAVVEEALAGNAAPLVSGLRGARGDVAGVADAHRAAFVAAGGDVADAESLAEFAEDYADAYADYAAAFARLSRSGPDDARLRWSPPEPPDVDPRLVFIAQIRLFLVMGALVAFWMLTDWKEGAVMVTFGGITGALAASAPNPAHYVRQLLLAGVLIPVSGFVFLFLLRPHADDFPTMCLFLSPFLAMGGWWISRQRTLLLGLFYGFWFMTLAATENGVVESFSTFADQSVSAIAGIAACLASYRLFMPAGSRWVLRMEEAHLRRRVVFACRAPLDGFGENFGHGTRAVFRRITLNHRAGEAGSDPLLRMCLAVLETGDTVIRLRESAGAVVAGVCERIAGFFESPDESRLEAARLAIGEASAAIAASPSGTRADLRRLHLLRGALTGAGKTFAPAGD